MMVELKRLEAADFPQAKALWKESFFDSDAFIQTYFGAEENVRDAYALVERGEILSQLFVLPFRASVMRKTYDAGFLSGCATAPGQRNRHLMSRLIRATFDILLEKGIVVSFLQPFLHAFYRKHGYETVAYVNRYEMTAARGQDTGRVCIAKTMAEVPLADFESAYKRFVEGYDNYFIRSTERFKTWLAMNFADGGKAAYVRGRGGGVAYALYEDSKGVAEIFELVCSCGDALRALVGALGSATFFLPDSAAAAELKPVAKEQFTMMRVLDPVAMLRDVKFTAPADFTLHIDDTFMEKAYDLRVVADARKTEVSRIDKATDFVMDIAEFGQMIAGSRPAHPKSGLHGVLPQGTSCVFETF